MRLSPAVRRSAALALAPGALAWGVLAGCGDTTGDPTTPGSTRPATTRDASGDTTTTAGVPGSSTTVTPRTSIPGAAPGKTTELMPPGGTAQPGGPDDGGPRPGSP